MFTPPPLFKSPGGGSTLAPSLIYSDSSSSETIAYPGSGINAGDLFIYIQYEEAGSPGAPTSGGTFTQLISETCGDGWLWAGYLIATGSESGNIVGTSSGGRDGSVLLQYRTTPVFSAFDVGTLNASGTDNPAAQTIEAGSATGAAIGLGILTSRDNEDLDLVMSSSITPDNELYANGSRLGVHEIVQVVGADWTISMASNPNSREEVLAAIYLHNFRE